MNEQKIGQLIKAWIEPGSDATWPIKDVTLHESTVPPYLEVTMQGGEVFELAITQREAESDSLSCGGLRL